MPDTPGKIGTAMTGLTLDRLGPLHRARFRAMAGPCELLIDGGAPDHAEVVATAVAREAWRIESTYSRYRDASALQRINRAHGQAITVDEEMATLLDFAANCHAISGGAFDVTSGVLREAWTFDGSNRLPTHEAIAALLPRIGWQRVDWRRPVVQLPIGMQIDLGGIGKEYAVDRALAIACAMSDRALLVNFGGDLHASAPPASGVWQVGIESLGTACAARTLQLERGALATSGDARRYLLANGVRYGHVLDPRTGWPVADTPRSVTVAADSCTEAGVLATLAVLQGRDAETFLEREARAWWVQRE